MSSATGVPLRSTAPLQQGSKLSSKNYTYLQQYVLRESGILLEEDKQYLLESRLIPVLKQYQLESLDALVNALVARSLPTLSRHVIDAMTTNETLFFRDAGLFDALRTEILPSLLKRQRGLRPARIWSAAASSGQEAYSIAMLLLEMGAAPGEVEIFGTDLSVQILDRARLGKYGQFEVSRGLPTNLLMKYFDRSGLQWQVKEQVRKLVRFEQLDLRKNLRLLGEFDLIMCRNVLIYFDAPTKGQILDALKARLAPGGLLALGCAETIINVHTGFRRKSISQSTFYSRMEDL